MTEDPIAALIIALCMGFAGIGMIAIAASLWPRMTSPAPSASVSVHSVSAGD